MNLVKSKNVKNPGLINDLKNFFYFNMDRKHVNIYHFNIG